MSFHCSNDFLLVFYIRPLTPSNLEGEINYVLCEGIINEYILYFFAIVMVTN